MVKSPDAFRTISEVAEWLDTPAHVLRFWESKFNQVKPVKRAGGRRYYRPEDVALLGGIKSLLRDEGMTIKGAQKLLRERGARYVASLGVGAVGEDTVEIVEVDAEPVETADVIDLNAARATEPVVEAGLFDTIEEELNVSTETAEAEAAESAHAAEPEVEETPIVAAAPATEPDEPVDEAADPGPHFLRTLRALKDHDLKSQSFGMVTASERLATIARRMGPA